MKLGKGTVQCLLLGLVCLNLLVRFPRTSHETGVDSFFVHSLATAISETGSMPWVLNPLGYFGWYPMSYPTAGPLIISGVAQTSGLTAEGAILLLSLLYSVLGPLVAFAMARAFRKDDMFALIVALIFSLAPRFMAFTLWSASTRNLFMLLTPVFLWMFVRAHKKPSAPNMILLLAVLMLMLATHRLTILMAVVVLAFIMAFALILMHRVVRLRFPKVLLSRAFRRTMPWLVLVGIIAIAAFMILGTSVRDEYSAGEICSGPGLEDQLCNLSVSITRSVGLALPFAVVGVFELVRRHNKGFLDAFLVLSLLSLLPTLFLRTYTGFYILPFLAILAAGGVIGLARWFSMNRLRAKAVLAASVLAITGFSLYVLEVEVDRATYMTDATYTTSLYVHGLPQGGFVTNDGLLGVRVSSIAARWGLPVGGAGTTSQSPEILIMGLYNASEITDKERRKSLTELTIEDDSPFFLIDIDARGDWTDDVFKKHVAQVSLNQTIRPYGLQYFIENDGLRDAYTAYGSVWRFPEHTVFPRSVHATRYKIFDGSTEDIYLAFSPL